MLNYLGATSMRFPSAILLAGFAASPAFASDLAKIDRAIKKEPTYAGKPLYGLVVIGLEAKTRVWCVIDGEKLYVDKNRNGDLTDDGPPAEIKDKSDPGSYENIDVSPDGGKSVYQFDVTLWHRPSQVDREIDKDVEPYHQSIHITFPDGRWFGAWGDQHQSLMFSEKSADAPILHFGGPLRMGFEIRQPLRKVSDEYELNACVGTPGSGPGAWVHQMYRTIPKEHQPKITMEFPPEKPGGPPIRVEFALTQRC